uniref:3-hydroxyisobutyrate dehydrogenase n=2 Tax=Pinguiococcus pyrenoidosus TaxID=172671 RepID=A0A7R9YA49_9STRA
MTVAGCIGFVGLGQMGCRMVRNLLLKAAAPRILLLDLKQQVAEEIAAEFPETAARAGSLPEMTREADVVISMLPACAEVQAAYLSEEGILKHAKEGSLLVDCSTVAPSTAELVQQGAAQRGLDFASAPVSGGVLGAEQASLTFMLGGEERVLERAEPVLRHMGKKVVHCGGAGSGAASKLCNNLALAIQMIGTSEALGLGSQLGVKPEVLASIMNASTARCWSSDTYNPCPHVMENVPSSRGYAGGFGVRLMHKDLTLALEEGHRVGSMRLPLGQRAAEVYAELAKSDEGGKDFSVVFKHLFPEIVKARS